ncbi:MAG: DUF4445 domain-containing protein [Candidatus Omnitrophica bacterium]|nr:DUF4445 domain-containing protein [Candidatus Omnitrophota bacterium]
MVILILDIGTTTIKGLLVDKKSRRDISSGFVLNSQARFGEDVITRIDFAVKGAKNQETLRLAATGSINLLIKKLLQKTGLKQQDIKEAVIVCNTAMHHLFLGISAECLIRPPYKTSAKSELVVSQKTSGININKNAQVIILPNIGGFVGSDALAFIIASGIYKSKSVKLGVDIGTNGEIILGSSDKILVTSTAAGSAFETWYIKHGSDIIDAAAHMLRKGLMDKTGRMKQGEFVLSKKGAGKIRIKQADIRKMQLAKAAIYAGIKILMRQLGVDKDNISGIFITGTFGNFINAESAIRTGLIPDVAPAKVKFMKNAPATGAKEYALSKSTKERLTSILSRIKRIPMIRKDFQQTFADSMRF